MSADLKRAAAPGANTRGDDQRAWQGSDNFKLLQPATTRPLDRPEALDRIGRWVDEGQRAERRVPPALVEHLAALTPHRVALEVARGRLDFHAVLVAVGYRPTLVTPHGTRTHLANADGTASCNATMRGTIAWSTSLPTCQTCRRWST